MGSGGTALPLQDCVLDLPSVAPVYVGAVIRKWREEADSSAPGAASVETVDRFEAWLSSPPVKALPPAEKKRVFCNATEWQKICARGSDSRMFVPFFLPK